MAKSSRKTVGLGNLNFKKIDPYGNRAAEETAVGIYSLTEIFPDPNQPRRLLPQELNEPFFSGNLSPADALDRWIKIAAQPNASPTAKEGLKNLRTLANSIEQQGLINPISVRKNDDTPVPSEAEFLIVTGERRWWAHQLLAKEQRTIREGNKSVPPTKIKATQTAEGTNIRAHQLIENIMREDISLLEKADGILALREELAVLAHGDQLGEPDMSAVRWGDVDKVLGISRQYRARIMKVLEFSPEAQQIVERYGLTERAIRPIAQKLLDYPELQIEALNQVARWQEEEQEGEGQGRRIITSTAQLVEQLLQRVQATDQPQTSSTTAAQRSSQAQQVVELRAKIRTTLRYVNKIDPASLQTLSHTISEDPDYADVVEDLQALRQKIDELLE